MANIAIVGMAGRFPRAADIEEFWRNIRGGVECITFADEAALAAEGIDAEAIAAPNFIRAGGKLDDADAFDAVAFGISPREATLMDPQHRIFLEAACHALDHAGYDPARFDGPIGVFGGVNMNTYMAFKLRADVPIAESTGRIMDIITNDKDYVTSRVSYKLGLRGPSITVQTACSTSLVAVAMACDSLRSHQCDMALAGGASVTLPQYGYYYREDGIASPDGHCRPFDEKANGTLFGSGVGVVVLKREEDAIADGDTIYALIRGTAVNNDGHDKIGYAAPSVEGQAAVIAEAIAHADVPVESIGFLETHGTGTPLGDAVEIAALKQVFEAQTGKRGFCTLGTVKANIGHLVSAAGVASLIKTALIVGRGEIPPNCNFERTNAALALDRSPFILGKEARIWKQNGHPRRAGVSSFGIGGTNVHVVLEQAPARERTAPSMPAYLLPLSARTEAELDQMAADMSRALRGDAAALAMGDIAHTLQNGRRQFPRRRVVVCRDHEDGARVLAGEDASRALSGVAADRPRPVIFSFSGGGAQYVGLARELYDTLLPFRKVLDQCADLFAARLSADFRPLLFASGPASEHASVALEKMVHSLPVLFSVQYALAMSWMDLGVRPAAMLGHSLGEYVAACVAGVLSLEDAVEIVSARSRLFDGLPPGAMTSVSLSERELVPLLPSGVAIAAKNGEEAMTVSGPPAGVAALEEELRKRSIEFRRLRIPVAAHSSVIDAIVPEFVAVARRVRLHAPEIPYVSNVTGDWITAEQSRDPTYFGRHLRQTVRFAEGIARVLANPDALVLDMGPGGSIAGLVRKHPMCELTRLVVSSTRHAKDESVSDLAALYAAIGRLWLAGVPIEWEGLLGSQQHQRVPLPAYPFARTRYWADHGGADLRLEARRANLYATGWERVPGSSAAHTAPCSWLVVGDDQELAQALASEIVRRGGQAVARLASGPDEIARVVAAPRETPTAGEPMRIVALTRGAECVVGAADGGDPRGRAVAAILAAAASELSDLHWTIIDVTRAAPLASMASALADAIARADSGDIRALRGGFAWTRKFTSVRAQSGASVLSPSSTVLVTGAGSAMGAALVSGLSDFGVQVLTHTCDPTDRVALERLLRTGGRGGAPVDGIVHVLSSSLEPCGIEELPSLAEQIAQTQGELTLLESIADAAGTSWGVVTGSLAGIVGAPGLAQYGVDTMVGNAFASARWAKGGTQWTSFALDAIAVDDASGAAMTARDAIEAMAHAITARPAPEMVLCKGELRLRMEARRRPPAPESKEERRAVGLGRENLARAYVAPRTDLERIVAQLWEEMLGYTPIGIHDDFFELGGDSLAATRLIARLSERVSVRIPLKRILQRPSVAGVAEILDELLIEKVAAMSDHEAEHLLNQL